MNQNSSPKISVIVPVYKVEKYLRACIDSILAQTFTDFELILVDDGSPDNCGVICDEYRSRDERIIVIHKENGGVTAARRDGVERSRGEWIAFVDPDDLVSKYYLDVLSGFVADDISVVEGSHFTFYDEGRKPIIPEFKPLNDIHILRKDNSRDYAEGLMKGEKYFAGPWGKLIRSNLLKGTDALDIPVEIKVSEDQIMCLRIAGNSNFSFAIKINANIYAWRIRPNSALSGTIISENYALKLIYYYREALLRCLGEDESRFEEICSYGVYGTMIVMIANKQQFSRWKWLTMSRFALSSIKRKIIWLLIFLFPLNVFYFFTNIYFKIKVKQGKIKRHYGKKIVL